MPRVPLLEPAAPVAGRRASSEDYGGGGGQVAVGRALGEVAEVGARLTDTTYQLRAARAAATSAMRLRTRIAEITADQDFETYETRYDEAVDEIRGEEGENLPSAYRDAYETELADLAERGRIEVRNEGRKRALGLAQADAHESLRQLADLAAEAESDADLAAVDQRASRVLGLASGSGAFDPAETDKARHAYEKAAADGALARGLASDPAATMEALEARRGVFGRMTAKDREQAILTAKKRTETLARARRAEASYALRLAERAERRDGQAAVAEAFAAALTPEGLTPERFVELAPRLERTGSLGQLTRLVAQGGKFAPGPPDTDYYRQIVFERTFDPAAHAERILDATQLGTAYKEAVDLQALVASGRSDPSSPYWREVETRGAALEEVEGFFDVSVDQNRWTDLAREQRDAFMRDPKNAGREPNDIETRDLLDQAVLRYQQEAGIEPALSRPGVTAIPIEDPLAGISAADLATVRASLAARGLPATGPNIRRAYERAVAAGKLGPASGLAGP